MNWTISERTPAARIRLGLAIVSLLLLPAANRLTIVVDARGLHTIRFVEGTLLLAAAVSLLALLRTYQWRSLQHAAAQIAFVAAPLCVLVVINTWMCVECGRESFARPLTVFRGLALLVASHLLFMTFSDRSRERGVLVVASVAAAWAVGSTVILLNENWRGPLLYSETPYLHQPFSSPVQAANFAAVVLLVGCGAAMTLNRSLLLYLFVPAFTVAIGQSGSRSGMLLLLLSWCAFGLLLVARHWVYERAWPPRKMAHVLASGVVAALAIWNLRTTEMVRALSFIGLPPHQIVSAQTDDYRARVWYDVVARAFNTTFAGYSKSASNTSGDVIPVATPTVAVIDRVGEGVGAEVVGVRRVADARGSEGHRAVQEAPHNTYLEFLIYAGPVAALGLIIFVVQIVGITLHYAWCTRQSARFPLAISLVLAVLFVAALNVGNVTLHLTFVWVLFGFATACAASAVMVSQPSAHSTG